MADRSWVDLVSEVRDHADLGVELTQARRLDRGALAARFTSCRDLCRRALATVPLVPPAPPAPEPEPEPPPRWADPRTYLQGFAGATHWDGDPRATDWYLPFAVGTWLGWPLGGHVTRVATRGPMGTNIVTAVLYVQEGPWQGWGFGFAHVLDTIRTGYREAHEPFMQYGNSGIEGLPGNAEHIHFLVDAPGGAGVTGDAKGDVIAVQAFPALGLDVQLVDRIPGPQDYLSHRASRGRFV